MDLQGMQREEVGLAIRVGGLLVATTPPTSIVG